jgi:predicted deacylase
MEPLFKLGRDIQAIRELDLTVAPRETITKYWLNLVSDGLGMPVYVPIIVAKGASEGKVLGLTAAIHGNELNGIPVVQRIFKEINVHELEGTIVGVPAVNIPSLLRKKRRFIDGTDLNHIMPGKVNGNASEVYAWRFVNQIVKKFHFLIDLHTASFGRVNSFYIRADMEDNMVRKMALLQNADIIVHNPPSDGTLRGTADEMGIPAITLELGNPNTFQKQIIQDGITGIMNTLIYLGMIDGNIVTADQQTTLCKSSFWLYTRTGGIMTVHPNLTTRVKKGEIIATMSDLFGDLIQEYRTPQDGIIIGKSVNPINQTGGRILHLGILE